MNSTIISPEKYYDYPTEEEVKNAVKICCGRHCNACESPVEYAWRRRRTDLADLVNVAIERELTDSEKGIVTDIYFNYMTPRKVAEKRKISRSAVYKTLRVATEKLKKPLSYVVMYQQDFIGEGADDTRFYDALNIAAAGRRQADSTGEALKNLRLSQALTLTQSAKAAGLSVARLRRIENMEAEPTFDNVLRLCTAYGISIHEFIRRLENG
ncbi:MAG: helix-turn-helix domain-containing protein [Clostridia bacterium]|nr:helix-turn-helix domain-containing protein [Clostridia bacterium]